MGWFGFVRIEEGGDYCCFFFESFAVDGCAFFFWG